MASRSSRSAPTKFLPLSDVIDLTFDLAMASDEFPQSIHIGVCIQGHCHLYVYEASDKTVEYTIAFHKAMALLHMKRPEKIHAGICKWRKVG